MNDEFLKFKALKKQITRGPFATSLYRVIYKISGQCRKNDPVIISILSFDVLILIIYPLFEQYDFIAISHIEHCSSQREANIYKAT